MPKQIKEIGHVVRLSTRGFVVRVERYGSGRKLPQPRILVDESNPKSPGPFTSVLAAINALQQFREAPRSVKPVTRETAFCDTQARSTVAAPRRLILPIENSAQHYEDEHAAARRKRGAKAPRVNPAAVKLLKREPERRVRVMKSSMGVDALIAAGFPVTRCPDGAQQRDSMINHKGAGILPGHLDPREMLT
jgi:hypothetical protein